MNLKMYVFQVNFEKLIPRDSDATYKTSIKGMFNKLVKNLR